MSYDRAVRVLAWSFILIVLLIVSLSQLWPVQPQIFATLILAGIFVLVVHELLPVDSLGTRPDSPRGQRGDRLPDHARDADGQLVEPVLLPVRAARWAAPRSSRRPR